jgi:hypothetical protein
VSDDWCLYDEVHREALHDWLNERPPPERPAPAEYEGLGGPPPPRPDAPDLLEDLGSLPPQR